MPVCLMVMLEVNPERREKMLEGFKLRHAQSMRLGALSHDVWELTEPGEDAGRWMGTMTFRDMAHFSQFVSAQDADPEAQATIQQAIGPGGLARILSQRIAVQIG